MGKLLFDKEPRCFNEDLAVLIGLEEAIVLQQIHYWLEINRKANKNFREGRYWTYNTQNDWLKDFKWMKLTTLKRVLAHLEKIGVVIAKKFNAGKWDHTKWYSIEYEMVKKLEEMAETPDKSDCVNLRRSNGSERDNRSDQNETFSYTEISSKNSSKISKRRLSVSSKTLCDTSLSETSSTNGDASKPENPESLDSNPVPDQPLGEVVESKNKDTLAAIPPKKKNLTYDEHGWLQLPTKHKNYKLASKLAIRRMQIVIIFDVLEDFEVEWQDGKPYFNSGWDEGFENEFFAESTGQALRALRDYGAAHHDLTQDWYNDRLEELFLDSVDCCAKKGVAWVSKVLDDGMVFAEFNDTDTEFE